MNVDVAALFCAPREGGPPSAAAQSGPEQALTSYHCCGPASTHPRADRLLLLLLRTSADVSQPDPPPDPTPLRAIHARFLGDGLRLRGTATRRWWVLHCSCGRRSAAVAVPASRRGPSRQRAISVRNLPAVAGAPSDSQSVSQSVPHSYQRSRCSMPTRSSVVRVPVRISGGGHGLQAVRRRRDRR